MAHQAINDGSFYPNLLQDCVNESSAAGEVSVLEDCIRLYHGWNSYATWIIPKASRNIRFCIVLKVLLEEGYDLQ